ncbi:MAG: hypothetical protein MUC38_15580 [Cyclobacteriaceae bacterium]|jgi:hypothetical protein|nr:hypothetical protein [Cyclobacteriaceae bacterium]
MKEFWPYPGKSRAIIAIATMLGCTGYSCTSTRVAAYPRVVGHVNNEVLLVTDVTSEQTTLNRTDLIAWANKAITQKLPSLKTRDYMETVYRARQHGVHVEQLVPTDTAALRALHRHLNVTYALFPRLILQRENESRDPNSPSYDVREAVLQLVLVDLRSQRVLWNCVARSRVSPLVHEGRTFNYSFNPMSSNRAFTLAYRKSINKLIRAMDFYYPQREGG